MFLNNHQDHRCVPRSSSHHQTCLPHNPACLAASCSLCCSTTAVAWSSGGAVGAVGLCARSPLLLPAPEVCTGSHTPSLAWKFLVRRFNTAAIVAPLPTSPKVSLPLPPAFPSLVCPTTTSSIRPRSIAPLLLKTVCLQLLFQLWVYRRVNPRRGSQQIRLRRG